MKTAIWWIRRDLRLADNQALAAALEAAEEVLPVFILDPVLSGPAYTGKRRLAFLYQNLQALNADLAARGSRLVLRLGAPQAALEQVAAESGAQAIYAEADFSPYACRRDARVAQSLPLRLAGSASLFPPPAVLKPDGSPYKTFTPFSKAWKALPFPGAPQPAPVHINTPAHIASLDLPTPDPGHVVQDFLPGEAEGARRLQAFTAGAGAPVCSYAERRNLLAEAGTSQLSPYLRFGLVSARQAVFAARQAMAQAGDEAERQSAETWLNELIWREFFISILYHFPEASQESFQPRMRALPWLNDVESFRRWCEGRTGYPVVDAAMRQLTGSGWMHNRARMITASFLTRHLLVDWRWGEKFFMQHLVDGDPAANNGGWQWSAGTGVDAAPYFRIFNPVTQGQKYDPQGVYIRRWVPELSAVPDETIHTPWDMPLAEQQRCGVRLGADYPLPVVEHAAARQRALAAYARTKA